ncbi:phosphocholine cytidylyltransferase family protein [Solibacillus daqui]|uniref:phosphocholine cytidylyltransferase family protein n=1 Tax=Solibacillus daqui TaxID=2912187 RepID=UPI002365156B|nr:phosphocholine cytidylyltransferase family protein [Solibacillus daqui]
MKTAVIVAAGLSSRLYPLTKTTPKCLLQVGKEKILRRNLRLLKQHGIEEIIIVTGYLKHLIEDEVKNEALTVYNPFYKHCNNMGSLYCTKNYLNNEPFLYLHGDVVFSETLLQTFLENIDANHFMDLAVDFKETDEEAMKVELNKHNCLIRSSKEILSHDSKGEWIGLAAIHQPKVLFDEVEQVLVEEHLTVYDTYAFTRLAQKGRVIKCHSIHEEPWMEIDFVEDYEKARELFQ